MYFLLFSIFANPVIYVSGAFLPAFFHKLIQHDLVDRPVDAVIDPLPDIFCHTAVSRFTLSVRLQPRAFHRFQISLEGPQDIALISFASIYPPPAPLTLLTSPDFFSMDMSCSR